MDGWPELAGVASWEAGAAALLCSWALAACTSLIAEQLAHGPFSTSPNGFPGNLEHPPPPPPPSGGTDMGNLRWFRHQYFGWL